MSLVDCLVRGVSCILGSVSERLEHCFFLSNVQPKFRSHSTLKLFKDSGIRKIFLMLPTTKIILKMILNFTGY